MSRRKKNLAKLSDDLRRLNERSEARTAAWHAASRALAATEEWLRTGKPGNCTLEAVETELPKLNKGDKIKFQGTLKSFSDNHLQLAGTEYGPVK